MRFGTEGATSKTIAQVRAETLGSGFFWDETLDLYVGGAININFYNNILGFLAGECISGTIDIEIQEPFPSSELTLEFTGVERSHINTKNVLKPLPYHRETRQIITMKTVVATFEEGQHLQPGQYTYSFQIYLPPWLPESALFKTDKERFCVEYTVRAQFTPTIAAMYVTDKLFPSMYPNVSLFRGSRKVYVYQVP